MQLPPTAESPLKIKSPAVNWFIAITFTSLIWLLFRTLRIRLDTDGHDTSPYDPNCRQRYLFSLWHDSMLLPVFAGWQPFSTGLTSSHYDGSFVAAVLKLRNVSTVRGSTNKIRTGTLRELFRTLETRHLVITPDGPRGPNRTVSPGIVYLASRSGRSIVTTGFACSRCWKWKGSWSCLVIPKPFSKLVIVGGAPISVPPDLNSDELAKYVDLVQASMDALDLKAQAQLTGSANFTPFTSPKTVEHRDSRAA